MTRKPIGEVAQEDVLVRSARRCALCFGLDGSLERVRGQLAHIDGDHANSIAENLAYLCLPHHDEYDSRTSQSKGITERELRNYRNRLYDAILQGLHHPARDRGSAVRADYLEHDRRAFQAGDELLPETYLRDFLRHVGVDHSYRTERLGRISQVVYLLQTESARFLLSDILPPLDELLARLEDVQDFLATHFFPYPMVQKERYEAGTRCCLYPDHNLDRGGGGTIEERMFYDRHAKELGIVLEAAREAYAEYRRTVKRTLAI